MLFSMFPTTLATRAGDYYMFEEMDDKFELDLIHDEIDFLEEENITESEMKMQRRKTLYDVSFRIFIVGIPLSLGHAACHTCPHDFRTVLKFL